MSIVTECQFCNELRVCYSQQTEGSSVLICDGCREESTQCTSCGVITDYYEYDKDGFIECMDCIDKGKS
ncbi:hypothetical protein ABT56_23100 [Photobacterium aquae]|uniref:Uncharacterized protein n=1 Tax=Photobacterium aquae TaxID=1195763 RepID=A0A0J1GGL2_9GAMM|nr:hypothetical protein ABT56_23100 [Photobacterium aquae]